jgi:hypothetical protein
MKGKLLLGLAGGFGLVMGALAFAGSADAEAATICVQGSQAGTMQTCTYSRPYGISSIFITNELPDGTQAVVWNEAYDCESPIEVTYVRQGPTGILEIEACDPPVGVGGGDNGSFVANGQPSVTPEGANTGTFQLTFNGQTTSPAAHGFPSACYADYRVCDLASYECEHLGQGCPPPSSPLKEAPAKLKSAN